MNRVSQGYLMNEFQQLTLFNAIGKFILKSYVFDF